MNANLLHRLSVGAVALALTAAACAPGATAVKVTPKPATPTKVAVAPTKAPTQAPKATVAPTKAPPVAPTQAAKPTAAPTAIPTAVPLSLGKPQTIGNLLITPSKIQTLTASGTDKPKAGNLFLEVTVAVENTSKSASQAFDPAQLLLLNPAGNATFSLLELKSVPNQLSSAVLKPGAKLSGVVIYEVPKDHESLSLRFGAAAPYVFWKLAS